MHHAVHANRAGGGFAEKKGCVQVNDWMEGMIIDCYEDLYRFKGVLAIKGWPDRFIFQVRRPHHPLRGDYLA